MKKEITQLGLVILLVFVSAFSAKAQTNDTIPERQLDQVTVEAQKQPEDLQKVPFSVSALDAEQIERQNIWNVRELRSIVPNLYFANPGDNRNVISMRGITTTSYEPAVATYVDGVNQFGLDTYFFTLNDIESIEVLRGPQGTLYGRNAMGGVINIKTKKQSERLTGFAKVAFGNYGLTRASVGVKTMIKPEKIYFGVSAVTEGLDGYYTNLYNDSNFDKQRVTNFNSDLLFYFNKGWELALNFKSTANRNNGPFALAPDPDSARENPFVVNQNATTEMVDNTTNTSMVIKKKWENLEFSSITAYQTNWRYYREPIDGDFSPIDAVSIVNNYGKDWNTNKIWTQEFRLAGNSDRLNWQVGLFGFSSDAPTRQGIFFGEDAGLIGSPITNFTNISTNIQGSTGLAVFGQAAYQLSDKFILTGGLRLDYEEKELTVGQELDFGAGDPMVTQPDTTGTVDFTAVTPKVSLAYASSETSNWYLSYSRGYRPGGLTQIGSDPSQPPLFAYDPEFSNNFEIGVKNFFAQRRIRWNVSAFLSGISDVQVPALILPDAIVITSNAGDVTSQGIESEFTALLTGNLVFDWNFGYTNATYDELVLPGEDGEVDYSGNKQIFTPEYTSFVGLEWTPQFFNSSTARWFVRGEWQAFGEQFYNLENTISQDSFSLLNAKAGVTGRVWEVYFWARNITDEVYVDYAYNFGASHLGNPATFGGEVVFRF
ncbi:TonB-dependent receptor [Algoriphagus sediminis]|uniref:TonB-dependent receptor n=1 Tax=Algoriphagus sediminis TaxID=3057113 RepID=A0ABT7Y9W4_9BACT|nr:TonB-dependent receptor [Algoriphagus sediminis]MDN3203307.1 TonB-dependent receptor [Algoriphagus sediminis]